MVTEEFSFPTIHNREATLTDTPSLWRISSRVQSDSDRSDAGHRGKVFRRSFCDMGETRRRMDGMIEFASGGEEMDMLWEDLNDVDEEFESKLSPEGCIRRLDFPEQNATGDASVICSVQASKVSKASITNFVPSSKKHRVFLALKVFKKLLSLHKMSRLNKVGTI